MSTRPCFSFFIPGEAGRIVPDNPLWHLPLSGNSSDFSKNVSAQESAKGAGITIGDYFTAARRFLENDDSRLLAHAVSAMGDTGEPIRSIRSIRAVEIFLEKHGAFYHPLRVKVLSESGRSVSFVLNGAVLPPGLSLIEKEYHLLSCLEKRVSVAFTPRVFGMGFQPLETKLSVGFFLGEWFEGFREFHISDHDGERQLSVWASNGDINYLSLEAASVIYEQIAYILTAHYNIHTGEQIFPWHHAAGDFVVNPLAEGLPVRLITVRGYDPLMEFDPGAGPGENVLPALLFFFLNLSLRMQMDRLDGTGSTVFLGNHVLQATVHGFLRSLGDTQGRTAGPGQGALYPDLPGITGLREIFIGFLAGFSQEQLLGILVNLIQAWPGNALEVSLAEAHLESHCATLYSLFKNI